MHVPPVFLVLGGFRAEHAAAVSLEVALDPFCSGWVSFAPVAFLIVRSSGASFDFPRLPCPCSGRLSRRCAEVILIAWGVFFVASRREEPGLKARNFKKSYQRGKENLSAMWSARSEDKGKTSFGENDEERPDWDNERAMANTTGDPLGRTATGTPDNAVHVDFEGGRGRMRPWVSLPASRGCRGVGGW